ncbi:hypothetical protein FA048_05940 [Pedobacter polaris]|uniref:Uncharacterized protein n=1 Tax=Pedobacter polaris TaxID=2571273 RepID=A0A4U1CW91_9SPHI|nr:hypothetical protein FA048_05940 [Pedobacter polaris]
MKKCFNKNAIIPYDIDPNELILRVLFKPLFFSASKNKIKYNSFLPPHSIDIEQRSRVSVFRKDYSSDSNCKNSAVTIKMNNQEYVGFLSFLGIHLAKVNELPGISVKARLIYTPIDNKSNYRPLIGKFYKFDEGLPMHAEISYDKPLELDNPNINHRKYAEAMVKEVGHSVHLDRFPNDINWNDEPISFKRIA